MKKIVKVLVAILLVILITASIGWYVLEYDPGFTRDVLLQQARNFEARGRNTVAVWLYNLAYHQADENDVVAIELAQYYKSIGNYSKAEYTLTQAIEDGGGVELYVALCQTFVEQDKLRDAVIMLDKVSNPQIKAQLDALRPAAPQANYASGHYSQYLSLTFTDDKSKIYAIFDGDYPSVATDLVSGPLTLSRGETTIHAVAVAENGLVSPMAEYNYVIGNVVEKVTFADGSFETALRELLEVPEGAEILSDQLWLVTEFQVPAAAVTCQDLMWLPNLTKLTISSCAFSDLHLLSTMTQLQTLIITDSVLSAKHLGIIASLPKLESLTLSGCYLSSIANLASATNLTYLDLSRNSIRDISSLAGMQKLEYLDLSENALIRLEDLAGLTGLTYLDVSYNSLLSTAPVASLVNLNHLDVSANGLFKLEGIDKLVELTWFAASNNNLIDVDLLAACTKLQTLIISNNTVLNLRVVENLRALEHLDFSYNAVSALPSFGTDCPLVVINGGYNLLTSLDNLAVLQKLEYIYMDYNTGIKKIDKLVYCSSLIQVNVYGSGVKKVTVLTTAGIVVNYSP